MGFILSTVCERSDLYEKIRKRKARSAPSIHGSAIEEHKHSHHQSVNHAHNGSLSSLESITGHSSSASSQRSRKSSPAAKHPELSDLIQQHRAEDREAAREFMGITRNALLSRDKRQERFKKYRERTLKKHQQTSRGNRVSKTPSRKTPQQVKVNENLLNTKKQKKGLDRLFAEAGYQ